MRLTTIFCMRSILRKEHESALHPWFGIFGGGGEPQHDANGAQSTATVGSEWSPKKADERKMLQFTTVRRIWTTCRDSRFQFPLDFCLGGTAPLEYFKGIL